jgi:hypothetical protein
MFRIIYLPDAFLVPAYLGDVAYEFYDEEDARKVISDYRVVYCTRGTKEFERHFVYINSKYTGENLVPIHLLDVVEVE